MIKVNLIKPDETRKPRRAAILAVLCAGAVISFPYLKREFGPADYESYSPHAESVALKKNSHSSEKKQSAVKRGAKKYPLKVAGFVRFADRNFAMLISGGRVRWVETGQSAFGFNVANIGEEGVSTEKGSQVVFIPFGK